MNNKFAQIGGGGKIVHYDMADIAPDQIKTSLELIIPVIGKNALEKFSPPSLRVFARENGFIRFVKCLCINYKDRDFYLKPCPVSFLDAYAYSKDDVCACFGKDECGFTPGNFDGQIAFILPQKSRYGWNDSAMEENMDKLLAYCKDMSRRDVYAKNIASHLYLNYDLLTCFVKTDKLFFDKFESYLSGHLNSYPDNIINKWETTSKITSLFDIHKVH